MTSMIDTLPDNIEAIWEDELPFYVPDFEIEPEDVVLEPRDYMDNFNVPFAYKRFLEMEFMLPYNEVKALVKEFKELYFEEIENERVRFCGALRYILNAKTGTFDRKHGHCNIYHKCLWCAERKRQETKDRLSTLIGKQIVTVDNEKERAKLVRRYGADKVYCVPTDNGKIEIIIDTSDNIGTKLDRQMAQTIADMSIAEKGKFRQSGNLGKQVAAPKEENEDTEDIKLVAIKSREFCIDSENKDEVEEILVNARATVKQETFDTKDELQKAVKKIEDSVERQCKERNIVVLFIKGYWNKYKLSDVFWSNNRNIDQNQPL